MGTLSGGFTSVICTHKTVRARVGQVPVPYVYPLFLHRHQTILPESVPSLLVELSDSSWREHIFIEVAVSAECRS